MIFLQKSVYQVIQEGVKAYVSYSDDGIMPLEREGESKAIDSEGRQADGKNLADLLDQKDYASINIFSDKYIHWLKLYYYIGGMPEAVQDYTLHQDVFSVREIQNQILELYESDFSKHTPAGELARLRMVWNSIPGQLARENRKFFFGQIRPGARAKDFELAIEWLLDCGLIQKVYRVQKPEGILREVRSCICSANFDGEL